MPVHIGDTLTIDLQTTIGSNPARGAFYVADDTTSPAVAFAGDLPPGGVFYNGENYTESGWVVSYDGTAHTFTVTVGTNYAGQSFHVGTRVGGAGSTTYNISQTVTAESGTIVPVPTLSAIGILVSNAPDIRLTGN